MSAYYSARIPEFLSASESELSGILSISYARSGFSSLRASQTLAWLADIRRLQQELARLVELEAKATAWTIILEFEIPRKQKRIDVVLLAGSTIVILEVKSSLPGIEALRQAEEYALLLHYFHRPSHRRRIITFVVSPDDAQWRSSRQMFLPIEEAPAYWVALVQRIAWPQVADVLLGIEQDKTLTAIDPHEWLKGEYHPVPTIIDAAKELEAGLRTVREIAHSRAARHDIDALTQFVDNVIQRSRAERSHVICFITGVPGSGKTLVGLNLALASSDSRYPIHFMSGTGPLVKVLQAVLARSHRARVGCNTAMAMLKAKALIENVHLFASEYFERDTLRPPSNHVVIFDEAQRAWNLEQNKRKFKRERSEPEMLLQIMERHQDWSVVIALVGGGQEINSGEAGLGEWGRALLEPHRKGWEIFASKEAVEGGPSVAGTSLFEGPVPLKVHIEPPLHLDVAIRNLRADDFARWVNHVLDGDADAAKTLEAHRSFPIYLTRSLAEARTLLNENARGVSRSGLVASSKATRLRAEGLEPDSSFHAEYPWEHWYLSGPADVRSSYRLEVFATEFEIQGLELDWVGVCWGGDYIWSAPASRWLPREFRMHGSKWREMTRDEQRLFRKNSYRVLLTRARQGIVIFVPTGDPDDPTRSPREFDETADFLLACGAQLPQVSDCDQTSENTGDFLEGMASPRRRSVPPEGEGNSYNRG